MFSRDRRSLTRASKNIQFLREREREGKTFTRSLERYYYNKRILKRERDRERNLKMFPINGRLLKKCSWGGASFKRTWIDRSFKRAS